MNDKNEKNRELLYKYRDSLNKGREKMSDSFDKYLLTFSTGSLYLSVSFTNVIIKDGIIEKRVLAIAWVLLILSILVVLVSFNLSEAAHSRQIDIADAQIKAMDDEKTIVNQDNCWISILDYCRAVSILTFVLGISLITYFYFLNLK